MCCENAKRMRLERLILSVDAAKNLPLDEASESGLASKMMKKTRPRERKSVPPNGRLPNRSTSQLNDQQRAVRAARDPQAAGARRSQQLTRSVS
jgi:hypothetical protein